MSTNRPFLPPTPARVTDALSARINKLHARARKLQVEYERLVRAQQVEVARAGEARDWLHYLNSPEVKKADNRDGLFSQHRAGALEQMRRAEVAARALDALIADKRAELRPVERLLKSFREARRLLGRR
jgi:hypothetical protein